MRSSILCSMIFVALAANAADSVSERSPAQQHVETTVTELAPDIASLPASSLPEDELIPAPYYKGERFKTSLGTVILNGGYIGEGNNYKLSAEFVCNNGRKVRLFTDLRFCEFRSVTNPLKGSFEVIGQKIRFNFLADKKPDFSGMTSCSGPSFKEVAVDCTLPVPPRPHK